MFFKFTLWTSSYDLNRTRGFPWVVNFRALPTTQQGSNSITIGQTHWLGSHNVKWCYGLDRYTIFMSIEYSMPLKLKACSKHPKFGFQTIQKPPKSIRKVPASVEYPKRPHTIQKPPKRHPKVSVLLKLTTHTHAAFREQLESVQNNDLNDTKIVCGSRRKRTGETRSP